jgi:prepilin-type processing-associated H-X9-DG protein
MSQPPLEARPPETPQVAGYAAVTGKPYTGVAVAALVLGIIGLVGLSALRQAFPFALIGLFGLICGIAATAQAWRDPTRYGARGLAIAGICASAACIIMLLTTVVLDTRANKRASARLRCLANLHAVGIALSVYENEQGASFPPNLQALASDHQRSILPASYLKCPGSSLPKRACDYYYVPVPTTSDAVKRDTQASRWIVAYEDPGNHPRRGASVLYLDGHSACYVEPLFTQELQRFKAEYEKVVGQPPTIIPPR